MQWLWLWAGTAQSCKLPNLASFSQPTDTNDKNGNDNWTLVQKKKKIKCRANMIESTSSSTVAWYSCFHVFRLVPNTRTDILTKCLKHKGFKNLKNVKNCCRNILILMLFLRSPLKKNNKRKFQITRCLVKGSLCRIAEFDYFLYHFKKKKERRTIIIR